MAIPIPLLITAGTQIAEHLIPHLIPIIAPLITPYIVAALQSGQDPATIDWPKVTPRSSAALQAEVDRQADADV